MIEITGITEHEDGSATYSLEMDQETMQIFARIGLLKVLTDAAEAVIAELATEVVG